MQPIQEELIVKEEKKYFVCIFLDDDKQCLVEKRNVRKTKRKMQTSRRHISITSTCLPLIAFCLVKSQTKGYFLCIIKLWI